MRPSRPEPLVSEHAVDTFDCGTPSLDEWLKRRALANQVGGASRTYVVCDQGSAVAYYAIAAGGVAIAEAPGRFRRNMPNPIPVVVLGRLAIDRKYQSRGWGRLLFQDAARRVLQAAEIIGVRGILVHAISAEARAFYLALGFHESPLDPMMLMISLAEIREA